MTQFRLNTINVAVEDLSSSVLRFGQLGLQPMNSSPLRLTEESIRLEYQALRIGETSISLISPLEGRGPVASHLAKRGRGFHSLSLEVTDLPLFMMQTIDRDFLWVHERPLPFASTDGSRSGLINWIHPRSTHGLLLEFIERR